MDWILDGIEWIGLYYLQSDSICIVSVFGSYKRFEGTKREKLGYEIELLLSTQIDTIKLDNVWMGQISVDIYICI